MLGFDAVHRPYGTEYVGEECAITMKDVGMSSRSASLRKADRQGTSKKDMMPHMIGLVNLVL